MSAKDAVIEAIRSLPDGLSEAEIVAELSFRFDPDNTGGIPDEEWEESWSVEAERRLDEMRSGKVQGIPHEEVMREMREKYG